MTEVREVTFTDELLADGSVHRRYADGREEWRTRRTGGVVEWRDNRGGSGTDEPLGERLVKRTHADGTVRYGRDLGYGRTLWRTGEVTVNRSSFGGRVGAILAGVVGVTLAGSLMWPPETLTLAEEEQLREAGQAGGGGGDAGGGGEGYDDWDGDDGADDDFG